MNYSTLIPNENANRDCPLSQMLAQEVYDYYEAGDYLPSVPALAGRFAVNHQMVDCALNELVAAGLVERHDNDAVFVPLPTICYVVSKNVGFTEAFFAFGKTISSRVLYKTTELAHGGVAERLRVTEGTPVIKVEVLRTVENEPFSLISHFLVSGHGVEHELKHYESGSLYAFLNGIGIELHRGFSLVDVKLPRERDANLLRIPLAAPILRVKNLHFDTNRGRPFEYAIARFRADRIQLSM